MINKKSILFNIIILGGISFCIALGMWQMQRLEWKQNLIKQYEHNQSLPALSYDELLQINNPEEIYFRKFSAAFDEISEPAFLSGKYNNNKHGQQMLVVNILPSKKKHLPIITGWCEDKNCTIEGDKEFSGTLIPTQKNVQWFMPQNDPANGRLFWPIIADLHTYFQMQNGVENIGEFIPAILINEKQFNFKSSTSPTPQAFEFSYRNDHKQYIITWFSLAVITFLMYLVLVFKAKK